jgi:hypothetical protein
MFGDCLRTLYPRKSLKSVQILPLCARYLVRSFFIGTCLMVVAMTLLQCSRKFSNGMHYVTYIMQQVPVHCHRDSVFNLEFPTKGRS